jgi:KUP system potassium uptake protein
MTSIAATADAAPSAHQGPRDRLPILMLGAVGVVYGDIGTSPLYAMKESFVGPHPMAVDPLHIFGVLSLIFWSLMMIVTVKYVAVAMRADNRGEGGSLALLAHLGNLQSVAAACLLTPGAVHQHLKSIETELGVKIYNKRDGRLELTDAGRMILPFVRAILAEHESAALAIRDWKDASRGVVRVGAGPTFCNYLLPKLLKRYRKRYPGIELYVETGTSGHLHECRRLEGGLGEGVSLFDVLGS